MEIISFELIIIIVLIAFIFEVMDSGAGMGFGTGLTPLLLLIGFEPLQIVPTILISESITGFVDSYFDKEFKNADFKFHPMSDDTRIAFIIAFFGCISIAISIYLTYAALNLPTTFIKIYVAILVLFMGIFGIIRAKLAQKRELSFKPKLMVAFAALAGFNKGVGGGGYGPVITLGEVSCGIYEKSATAIVSFSEAIVSVVGILSFIIISALGVGIDLVLLPWIFTGAFIGALITPYIVRVVPNKLWKIIIPFYAIGIGIYTLYTVFF
ncbi:MAG: TSUP family transporter [Candidatus Hermodarchaeota archaeon]